METRQMTKQEIFDIVAPALLKQNERAAEMIEEEGLKCFYRGPNKTKCAAGFLIPDEIYKPDMEGKRIITVIINTTELWPLRSELEFINDLQCMHDNPVIKVESWKQELIALANKYKISTACIDNL